MKPGFFVMEALRSIRSNVAIAVAATVTVMIAVFILGTFIPSFLYVNQTVQKQKERLDVNVYISDDATDSQVSGLQANINQLKDRGLVTSVEYISKEQALERAKAQLRDPTVLDLLPGNPYPASFKLKSADPARNGEIKTALSDSPALDTTMPGKGISYAVETTERLLSIARFIQYAGLVLVGILTVASVLLIGNTIRLSIFARRREVEVMRLVGATNWFIRWPFVIEGIICGIAGAIVAILMLWAAKVAVVDEFIRDNGGLAKGDDAPISFLLLALVLIVSGGIVGALGSGITLRRFLKI